MGRLFTKLAVAFTIFLGLLAPMTAHAATNPLGQLDCGKGGESAVCQSTGGDPLTGNNGVLVRATNIIAFIAGFAAVVFLILGGIKFITAQGAPAEIGKAKETIIYALVGLVLIAVARAVIGFVINRI